MSVMRSTSELPGLKQFRSVCTIVSAAALCVLLVLSCITFAPSITWIVGRAALISALVAVYFLIIAIRTYIIIFQCRRGTAQTFDRPAPEWITACFGLVTLGVMVWPHTR
jgi:hypothetical protein